MIGQISVPSLYETAKSEKLPVICLSLGNATSKAKQVRTQVVCEVHTVDFVRHWSLVAFTSVVVSCGHGRVC